MGWAEGCQVGDGVGDGVEDEIDGHSCEVRADTVVGPGAAESHVRVGITKDVEDVRVVEGVLRNGQLVQITPPPYTTPHPLMFIGGMSAAAARRAARFGLPFYPPMPMPELEQLYHDELTRHGTSGFVYRSDRANTTTIVHPDPDAAWSDLGLYLLNEAIEYASWKHPDVPRPHDDIDTLDRLRRSGAVEIFTPDQCAAAITGGVNHIVINPLAGGTPIDEGWKMLKLFATEVLPAVAGLSTYR